MIMFLGQDLLRNLLKMSDDELAYEESAETEQKAPSWMHVLSELGSRWLKILPEVIIFIIKKQPILEHPEVKAHQRKRKGSVVPLLRTRNQCRYNPIKRHSSRFA